MSEDQEAQFVSIREAIIKKTNGDLVCYGCKGNEFHMPSGYVNPRVFDDIGFAQASNGTARVPSVILICKNCGYMMQYSVGVLMGINVQQGSI